jgi:hypothetical protein
MLKLPKLPDLFAPPPLAQVRAQTIRDLELALHDAQLQLERQQADVARLQTSLNRLKAEHAHS